MCFINEWSPSFSGSQSEHISPEHELSSLTQRMDLTINGNDQYTLVGSRPVIFYWEKQAVEHLRTTFFSVLLLKACCFFLSHFGTQPPSGSLRLSLSRSCRWVLHTVTCPSYIIFCIWKPLMSFSSCETSKKWSGNNLKTTWNMLFVSPFRTSVYTSISSHMHHI